MRVLPGGYQWPVEKGERKKGTEGKREGRGEGKGESVRERGEGGFGEGDRDTDGRGEMGRVDREERGGR